MKEHINNLPFIKDFKKDCKPLIVACIPAYNEEYTIGGIVDQALKHTDLVLVCDDGSSDLTGVIAEKLGAVVIRHKRKLGYGVALKTLFTATNRLGADIVVTLDGDGQHDPHDIPRLVTALKASDVDIVIGSRFLSNNSDTPKWRKLGIWLITKLVNFQIKLTDAQSGYRAYNKRALESFVLTKHGMSASTEILLKAGENKLKVFEIPIKISYDKRPSSHNPVVQGTEIVLSTMEYYLMKALRFFS